MNTPANFDSKEAMQYLVNLGLQSAAPVFEAAQNGDQYVFYQGKKEFVEPHDPPQPDTFFAFSLRGLVDFIEADTDGLCATGGLMLRVADQNSVILYGPMEGYQKKRAILAKTTSEPPRIRLGEYMDAEKFNVMLQACFVETENRAKVLTLVGNIRSEQSLQTADDGFSQRVNIKQGAASSSDVIVRNPVLLAPRRTFPEIEQPESPFVLRFGEKGEVALFEADGGAWKIEAVEFIRRFLEDALHGDGGHANIFVIA